MKKLIILIISFGVVLSVLIGIGANIIYTVYLADNTEVVTSEEVITYPLEELSSEKSNSEKMVEINTEFLEASNNLQDKKRLTISAAGDCTLGYSYKQSTWNRFDTVVNEKGYDYFFENVREIFEADDLTIVNLEGPLTRIGNATEKEFVFRGEPEYTQILKRGSIEVVNLANNHTKDYGEAGYAETKKALQSAEIGYFGEQVIFYDTIQGVRVGIIGLKGWSSDKWVKDNITTLITKAKEQSDLIILMFHWGIEGTYYPNGAQKELAKHAIEQGAHLILGSHPHVIQGIESYQGRNIVYSLGNFCFGGNRNPSDKDTFIYQETFELTEDGIVSIGSNRIACSISSVTTHNDYRPTPLAGSEKIRVQGRLEEYSQFK